MTEVAARGNGVLVQVAPGAVKSPWSSSEATWAPCSGCHCWSRAADGPRGPCQPQPSCDAVLGLRSQTRGRLMCQRKFSSRH